MSANCPQCSRDCKNPQNLALHLKARHAEYLQPDQSKPSRKKPGPPRKYDTLEEAYAARKAHAAAKSREISAAGRDIAPLPAVEDPARRARCEASLEQFCLTYYPAKFYLPFSAVHQKVIAKAERAIRAGGLFALAQPRGSGKSEICKRAAEWAVLCGHRRFVVLVGATDDLAAGLLVDIQAQLEANDLLAADFPEACYPVRRLERILLRARAQLYEGEPTRLEWTNSQIRLAQLPGSRCAGAIIRTVGMTGAIRGMSAPGPDGGTIRPDLVIVDDPQTRQSAYSPTQVRTREQIILGDILGLAGPTRQIACLAPMTVIAPDDLADQMLDRQKNPQWQGERSKLVEAFPTNQALWDEYLKLRDADLRADGDGTPARDFYVAHREAMDAGAVLSWPQRYDPERFLSALEEAMVYRHEKSESFAAEMQNEPTVSSTIAAGSLQPGFLADKSNHLPRGTVPAEAMLLSLGIDVHKEILYWSVAAWSDGFAGAVMDYGTWPRQNRAYFRHVDARPSLAEQYPGMDETARVFAGLKDLTEQLMGKAWPREGGGELRIEQGLIDSGWNQDLIMQFCRTSRFASNLLPSKGYGITASGTPLSQWTVKPGQKRQGQGRRGEPCYWLINPTTGGGRGRQCAFDSNYWKSFVANRLLTPGGGAGCLWLPAPSPGSDNGAYIDHLTAEYRVTTERSQKGVKVDEWKLKPNQDNHWLDSLVLAAVAGSVRGLYFDAGAASGAAAPEPPRSKREPLDLAAMQREYRARQGAVLARR